MTVQDVLEWVSATIPLGIHQLALIIGGVFMGASVIVSFYVITMHIKYWRDPLLQKYMCRIVFMIPVYVIGSYLSLVWKDQAFYFSLIRDCYEAYVLYMFFGMLIELADGQEALIAKLDYEHQIRCFAPLCCCHVKPGRIFLHRCKQMILQFVVIKPLLAVLIFLLSFFELYDDGDFAVTGSYLYITVIYNVSFTLALYFLVMFYESIKKVLAKHKPLSKFLCIKAVVFFSYWQSIIIAVMVHFNWVPAKDDYTVSDVATGTQNFLICIEMFPLAIAHIKSFGYKSYTDDSQEMLSKVADSSALQRVLQVANIPDVWKDTYDAMKRGPRRNVQVGNFLELSDEDKLKHVVKQGWLHKRGEDLAKIWKLRFCLLIDSPKGLVYFKRNIFEDRSGKPIKARGFVEFDELLGVAPHRKNENSFIITTAPRKWHFKAENTKQRDEWMEAIEKLHGSIRIGESVDDEGGHVDLDEV